MLTWIENSTMCDQLVNHLICDAVQGVLGNQRMKQSSTQPAVFVCWRSPDQGCCIATLKALSFLLGGCAGQPCADHDRASGEGAAPQEYTLIKMQALELQGKLTALEVSPAHLPASLPAPFLLGFPVFSFSTFALLVRASQARGPETSSAPLMKPVWSDDT